MSPCNQKQSFPNLQGKIQEFLMKVGEGGRFQALIKKTQKFFFFLNTVAQLN